MEERDKIERLSLLTELIKLARADREVRELEFEFLLLLADQMGITKAEFLQLFEDYIAFHPPKLEFERIIQLHRLVLIMNVDQEADESEKNHIREVGIRMGLHPMATEKVLEMMCEFPNGMIPPDTLISIFKTYHN